MPSRSALVWGTVFAVLVTFAIPWFMWRDATTVAGLPAWIWWHVGWLCLTAGAFAVFARRGWGTFVGVGQDSPRTTEGDR